MCVFVGEGIHLWREDEGRSSDPSKTTCEAPQHKIRPNPS